MKFTLKTKIIKMDDYNALIQRFSGEKAEIMANKFAMVYYSPFSGWVCQVFNKKGDVIAQVNVNQLSTVQAIATEFNEVEIDYTNGKIYIESNERKHKFIIDPVSDYFVCANCGKVIKIDGKRHRCRASNICNLCGEEIDAKTIKKYGNRGVCKKCWATQNSGYVTYSTKPSIDFLAHATSEQDLGIELEVDDPTRRANITNTCVEVGTILNQIEPYHKTFVTASDGSLYHGFEVKSSPRPLGWYLRHKDTLKNVFGIISNRGFKAHDTNTAGLHISVNVKHRSGIYPFKLAYFWNKNIKFFDVIARRVASRSSDCYYQNKDLTIGALLDIFARKSHRDVINLEHLDQNRVEIRHFKSTLKFETFIATLDIVQAVDKFLQSKTTEQILQGKYKMQEVINKLTTEEGKTYIKSKKQEFANAGYAVEVE